MPPTPFTRSNPVPEHEATAISKEITLNNEYLTTESITDYELCYGLLLINKVTQSSIKFHLLYTSSYCFKCGLKKKDCLQVEYTKKMMLYTMFGR